MTRQDVQQLKDLVASLPFPTKSVVPLDRLPKNMGSYRVRRNRNQVVFGCGAVKVSKKDLRLAADYLEIKKKGEAAILKLVAAWRNQNSVVDKYSVEALGANTLKRILG